MSARNPKRSSRLAAKEELREAGADPRKKGRADDGSPIADTATVSSPSQKPPPTTGVSPAARPSPNERRASQQPNFAGSSAEGRQAGVVGTPINATPVVSAPETPQSGPTVRGHHTAGVSAAHAASARKEASFNAQHNQAQQLQSNRQSSGSSTKRSAETHVLAASAPPGAAVSAQAASAAPQMQAHQKLPSQQQQQQQQQPRPAVSNAHHMSQSSQPAANPSTAGGKSWQQHQQLAQHSAIGTGSSPANHASANGRRAHAEGVAGDSARRSGGDRYSGVQPHQAIANSPARPAASISGHTYAHGSVQGHHSHHTLQQQALAEELRRGLGGAVERWISARNALPGEDSARFPSEIHRLVGLVAFDGCDRSRGVEERAPSDVLGGGSETVSRTQVTTTRFRLAHPEIKSPLVFEATNHIFAGSILGTGTEHNIQGLRWKVEFELIGFFLLALHTQTYDGKPPL
jgi:hypothetical protein